MKKYLFTLFIVCLSVSMISCGQKNDNNSSDAVTEKLTDGTPVSIAGVTFTPAGNWTDVGPSGMRKGSYYLSAVGEDTDSATINIFYFGPTGGGTIEANLDRWITQLSQPDGSDSHEKATMSEITVDDMTAHLLEVTGTYASGNMMGTPVDKEEYLLYGVVLEAPEGNLFFKLTGPVETARKMAKELDIKVKEITKNQ